MQSWAKWHLKKLDAELVAELADYFRGGATLKIAAGQAELPPAVLRAWLVAGEQDLQRIYEEERGYPERETLLYIACARATAEYLADRVSTVTSPQDADWRASSWLLERRDEDFNPAQKVEVTGAQGGPLEVEGRVIGGFADIVALARATAQGHLFGLTDRELDGAVPASSELLPGAAEPVDPAIPVPDLQGP